jgi:toxin ParE1/3/4
VAPQARIRYRALLTAAMRRIAADPGGRSTTDCSDLFAGVRSFHIRYSRGESREEPVRDPVHVIFYRVLHERMEPSRHVSVDAESTGRPWEE